MFLLWVMALVSERVPVWVRPWIVPSSLGVLLLAGYVVARRRPRPADPPREPRTADVRAQPAIPTNGRALMMGHLAVCAGAILLLAFVLAYAGTWMTASAGVKPEDGPGWYRATVAVGSCVILTIAAVSVLRTTYLLNQALTAASEGNLTRWTGTVTAVRGDTVTLSAIRADPPDEHRRVNFKEPGLPVDPLRPGDVLVMQGSPQRGGWVVITDGQKSRWQGLTMRQPPSPRQVRGSGAEHV